MPGVIDGLEGIFIASRVWKDTDLFQRERIAYE